MTDFLHLFHPSLSRLAGMVVCMKQTPVIGRFKGGFHGSLWPLAVMAVYMKPLTILRCSATFTLFKPANKQHDAW